MTKKRNVEGPDRPDRGTIPPVAPAFAREEGSSPDEKEALPPESPHRVARPPIAALIRAR